NHTTLMRFELPKRSRVSLIIYDITGKEVVKLINNKIYTAGEHEITWNGINQTGKEVSSGIYLYELRTEGFRETRKMILIQ
ncbi:MAG: T9SS type A sorting domain-containing protein, partial [Aliifodinibius sp.]|nr:T9SS type A sorting domain-containing protein [Fodinibius sp.]NIV13877.1 T9SS type A sorting domain-containing protein [Fodinibius sp.]NIY27629.1 T9SS type A sorting domain-containing protein [Fodinibius sp.]